MLFPKPKTPRDPRYLSWLRTLPCAFCRSPAPSEVSHHGRRGVGIKASDYLALPSCHRCHRRHHGKLSSPHRRYDSMSPDERRAAYEQLAMRYREQYLRSRG